MAFVQVRHCGRLYGARRRVIWRWSAAALGLEVWGEVDAVAYRYGGRCLTSTITRCRKSQASYHAGQDCRNRKEARLQPKRAVNSLILRSLYRMANTS